MESKSILDEPERTAESYYDEFFAEQVKFKDAAISSLQSDNTKLMARNSYLTERVLRLEAQITDLEAQLAAAKDPWIRIDPERPETLPPPSKIDYDTVSVQVLISQFPPAKHYDDLYGYVVVVGFYDFDAKAWYNHDAERIANVYAWQPWPDPAPWPAPYKGEGGE